VLRLVTTLLIVCICTVKLVLIFVETQLGAHLVALEPFRPSLTLCMLAPAILAMDPSRF